MSKMIEAMCYSRWSANEQQAGYSWKTTQINDEKIKKIVQDIQGVWDQIEYEEDIYLQGEWQAGIEVVYFGTVLEDRDESNRPTYVKQVWVVEKSLWEQLDAPFWSSNEWFTKLQAKQHSEIFLERAHTLKKYAQISRPAWLESFVAALIKNEEQTLIIVEDSYDVIFRTFALLPPKFKKENLTVTIGWHRSLLRVTTNFNVVFCHSRSLDQVQQDLSKYNATLVNPQPKSNAQVSNIIDAMFLRQNSQPVQPRIIEKQPLQQIDYAPKRVSLSSVVLVILLVGMSWFTVSSYLQVKSGRALLEKEQKAVKQLKGNIEQNDNEIKQLKDKNKALKESNTAQQRQVQQLNNEIAQQEKKFKDKIGNQKLQIKQLNNKIAQQLKNTAKQQQEYEKKIQDLEEELKRLKGKIQDPEKK